MISCLFFFSEANREYNHLSTNLYKASDYDKLALSLISPLPNEQDFAINVCTLLSNDGKHTLKLERHPRIVDYLLGHAGVFCHSKYFIRYKDKLSLVTCHFNPGSLRKLLVHYYASIRKHPIHNFWREVLEFREFLDLTDESRFSPPPRLPQKAEVDVQSACRIEESCSVNDDLTNDLCRVSNEQPICSRFRSCFKVDVDPDDRNLFSLGRGLGTQDYVGQRVLQVATILRNLSFIDENVPVLLRNKTFLRFLLLCAASRWSYLRNLGLDMLGNLAADFLVGDYPDDRLAVVWIKVVTEGLKSEDRASCISSLEVLNKLSQNERNEDTLLRLLEQDVYEKVTVIRSFSHFFFTIKTLYYRVF